MLLVETTSFQLLFSIVFKTLSVAYLFTLHYYQLTFPVCYVLGTIRKRTQICTLTDPLINIPLKVGPL